MGFCMKFFGVTLIVLLAVLYQIYVNISHPYPVPKFEINEYWGPGNSIKYKEDTTIKTHKIRTSTEVITDLKKQLNRTLILTEPLESINFEYGFNSKYLKEIIQYWRDDYLPRWRDRESYLSTYPHFTTQIQGLQIHFLHIKLDEKTKKTKKVYPLLLLHGWPGSVREFYDIIPKLIDPNTKSDYVFELIVPSLPGYGWSQASSKPGFGPAQMAVVINNLMLRLGYNKYFIQGGDWGSLIGSNIATLYPDNILGYHSNMCAINSPLSNFKLFISKFYPKFFMEKIHEQFFYPLNEKFSILIEESGYFHIQATKPDTIGNSLSNNPVGLATYILEKFSTWTANKNRLLYNGGLGKDIKLDHLFDNLMIYYLTNSITTSQRLYAEALTTKQRALHMERVPTKVLTGCARFRDDLFHNFDWQLTDKYLNLIHSSYHIEGGHFAALQLPNILYKDFIEFVQKVHKHKLFINAAAASSASSGAATGGGKTAAPPVQQGDKVSSSSSSKNKAKTQQK